MPSQDASKRTAKGFAEILKAARVAGLTASPERIKQAPATALFIISRSRTRSCRQRYRARAKPCQGSARAILKTALPRGRAAFKRRFGLNFDF
jgi:hypothetical protein